MMTMLKCPLVLLLTLVSAPSLLQGSSNQLFAKPPAAPNPISNLLGDSTSKIKAALRRVRPRRAPWTDDDWIDGCSPVRSAPFPYHHGRPRHYHPRRWYNYWNGIDEWSDWEEWNQWNDWHGWNDWHEWKDTSIYEAEMEEMSMITSETEFTEEEEIIETIE